MRIALILALLFSVPCFGADAGDESAEINVRDVSRSIEKGC